MSVFEQPCVWVLNLDAELELMRPQNYQPTKGSLAACARFSKTARALLGPGDVELLRSDTISTGCALGYAGRAWCPTPSVLKTLRHAGAHVEQTPSLHCLQTVNHRSFHASLGQTLPQAAFLTNIRDVLNKLTTASPHGWMVKRGFGFASRGVRRMPSTLTPDDVRWVTHALEYGGVQVEPWVPLIAEFSLHGYISPEQTRLGHPCVLLDPDEPLYVRVSDTGAASNLCALDGTETAALEQQAETTANELRTQGYRGPFGIDAFAYWWEGRRAFNARSEVNARYTLAYSVGMWNSEPPPNTP
jgi:hypothetical protein